MAIVFDIRNLSSWFGDNHVLKDIRMEIAKNSVTSVMGPSGCGKSTFIRCLNRMHDMTPAFRMEGEILLDGVNIYSESIDPVYLPRRVGARQRDPTNHPIRYLPSVQFAPNSAPSLRYRIFSYSLPLTFFSLRNPLLRTPN